MKSAILIFLLALAGLSGCVNLQHRTLPPEGRSVVGRYYMGDGLGYNVILNLNPDASYIAKCSGCLGEYGTAKGSWTVRDRIVLLSAAKETGMMRGHIKELNIVTEPGGVALVPNVDDPLYRQYGVQRHTAFQKLRE